MSAASDKGGRGGSLVALAQSLRSGAAEES